MKKLLQGIFALMLLGGPAWASKMNPWPYGPFIIDESVTPAIICVAHPGESCLDNPNAKLGTWDGTNFTQTSSATTTAVTQAPDNNSTLIANTAFVLGQAGTNLPLAAGTAAAGSSLRYARQDHVHPTDATRAPLASPTFTGTPAGPTATAGDSSTQLATTAFVATSFLPTSTAASTYLTQANAASTYLTTATAGTTYAPLASPTFTGVPAGPTAATSTNTTQLASTAFVLGQAGAATPLMNGSAAVGTSLLYARQDHVHPTDTSRAPLASPTFTGSPAAPTQTLTDNSTLLATTAFVKGQSYLTTTSAASTYAPLASPALTGVPTAPTAAVATNTTQVATTAFVIANAVAGGGVAPSATNAQSSAYTAVTGDKGKVLVLSGTWTLGTPAAATAGNGYFFWVRKSDGSGVITLDPNGSETINGLTSIAIYQESFMVWTDGSNWFTQDRPKGWISLSKVALTGQTLSATQISDGFLDSEMSRLQIDLDNFTFSATNAPILRVIKSGSAVTGSTYAASMITGSVSSATQSAATNGTSVGLTANNQATSQSLAGSVRFGALGATGPTQIAKFDTFTTGTVTTESGWFYESTATAVQGIQISPSTGTISTLEYTVMGYRQ